MAPIELSISPGMIPTDPKKTSVKYFFVSFGDTSHILYQKLLKVFDIMVNRLE